MKKRIMGYFSLLLIFCIVLTGCQNAQENPVGDTTPDTTVTEDAATTTADTSETEEPTVTDTEAPTATTEPSATPSATATAITTETATATTTTPGGAASTATSTATSTGTTAATATATKKPTSTPTKTATKSPSKTTSKPTATPKPTPSPVNGSLAAQNKENQWVEYTQGTNISTGMSWPAGQALPIYATPADDLDTISVSRLSNDEQITFSALQGIVNKTQPRIYLLDNNPDEGQLTWSNTFDFDRNSYDNKKYDLIAKYADEIKGVVIYSTSKSVHYRNLAATVANIKGGIPVTASVYNTLSQKGIKLEKLADFRNLTYTSEVDIYNYLYNNYWKDCSKRLIVSADPNGDLHHTRDVAASAGAAVVYLDCLNSSQKSVYEKFLKDMAEADSTSIVLGWYTTERSGITTATKYGVGTVPANFYISGTVYGGMDHTIKIPSVPTKDAVENKVYIAVYISDGDNIQYMQRFMRKTWDATASSRGKVPMNWTVSPALVDIGPGLLNYYYTNATDKECFVCGPSGIGYAMPVNTNSEKGVEDGKNYLTNATYLRNYTKLSGTYFERAGLRVVTIWDNLSPNQRKAYEENCRYLYGATIHDFDYNNDSVSAGTVNNLRFEKFKTPYVTSYNHLYNEISKGIQNWNGKSPLFLSYQVSAWGDDANLGSDSMNPAPEKIVKLYNALQKKYPGKFEFVRADHYFALYNEANNLDYNLCIDTSTKVSANTSTNTKNLRDGSTYTLWKSSSKSNQYVQFDLGATHKISRYVIRFAGANGMNETYNVRAYHVQVSKDGKTWTTVDTYKENVQNVVDIEISAVDARYVKIVIDDAAGDGYARIADVEIYGK